MYTTKINLSELLDTIGSVLDITEAQYQEVVERYTAVSNHLSKDGSLLSEYKPDIKPQGSFLLGTMTRPIMEDDELDVDLVCRLRGKKAWWTQFDLKDSVRQQLITNDDYKRMLDEEGNRCWTLAYHEKAKFHMDILPAIVNVDALKIMEKAFASMDSTEVEHLSIRITDKRLSNYKSDADANNWLKSNPFAYAAWFKERARLFTERTMSLRESIEPLPGYTKNKPPLVRVVQILKRHRDIMFGADETRPISCIITTLAAFAYNKENDIEHAIKNVLTNFINPQYIYKKYSPEHGKEIWWVTNPANLVENFADKWIENPELEKAFFSWYEKAKADFDVLKKSDITETYHTLKDLLGARPVNEAIRTIGYGDLISESRKPSNFSNSLLNVSHRQQPYWPVNIKYNTDVNASYKIKNGQRKTISSQSIIPKDSSIYFVASTNVPKPFDVYWQVVNTGEEAAAISGGLRGGIFHSKSAGKGGLNQREHSSYKGLHWVECFIVKDGICVSRSKEFFVNIE